MASPEASSARQCREESRTTAISAARPGCVGRRRWRLVFFQLIERVFARPLRVPEGEARDLLACNACCPDQRNVLLQRGGAQTCELLQAAGFVPIEVETGEFLKAGGSVFCMKLLYGSD